MTHWATNYIGKPWVCGARGPDAFDCFGLLWHVYKTQYGIDLPLYAECTAKDLRRDMALLTRASETPEWQRVAVPFDGCAVGLSTARYFHHVGVFLAVDGGVLLHALDRQNVILTPAHQLRAQGFNRVEFFKYKSWPA